ncbi:MAG: cbb3-type cytochrome c oxidase N-terminal domain-containing protein [Bacteroidales bacterium]|jgi:cytochrome c oxidase cbb3-type subunit 3|nr:cbb3-type cytochrome c oxidase N-terminal domain-containing protein [Bacteroidales bacterium]
MAKENINQQHNEDYEYDTLTNEKLIKDHDYDGIRELDNDLPPWWKWLFYLTIVFAVVYSIRLFVFNSDDLVQYREYANEMENAENAKPAPSEDAAAFEIIVLEDEASLASGKDTWDKICAVCHLVDGGGLVGPNMTDNYWIHGNTIEDLYKIVETGVIEKGMIPYKDQLSEQKRLEVVSFILVELHGSTPATPKAPQGKEY